MFSTVVKNLKEISQRRFKIIAQKMSEERDL